MRSIPARAGETFDQRHVARHDEVHPRACGGNCSRRIASLLKGGPSPRVRGKPKSGRFPNAAKRSIPARAGETCAAGVCRRGEKVHPRACGGNISMLSPSISMIGPSPRVRGKPKSGLSPNASRRSIPARAGETSTLRCRRWWLPVHPRACGGNLRSVFELKEDHGPSPRVRGKPWMETVRGLARRSIPARAGETRQGEKENEENGVHPRACGGNVAVASDTPPRAGPSPRVRGKRTDTRVLAVRRGSIPARAGETKTR